MNITPAELAQLLEEATAPIRRKLASAINLNKVHANATQRLDTNLNSAEKALAEKDAELEKLRQAWDDAEKHVSELTTEINATRANLSKQLDAATKRAVQAEGALVGVQALNKEYRGRIRVQTNRIAELEEALSERDAEVKKCLDTIQQKGEYNAELEAQLQGARAEVSKERETHPATAKLLTVLNDYYGSPLEEAFQAWLDAGAPGVTRG